MISATDLVSIDLFAGSDPLLLSDIARQAADVLIEPGRWLIREGEDPRIFIVLEGTLDILKEVIGEQQIVGSLTPGRFVGETAILFGTGSLISLRAKTHVRVARLERQQLQQILREDPIATQKIFEATQNNLRLARQVAVAAPITRVQIEGPAHNETCRSLQSFLSANCVQFDWLPSDKSNTPVVVSTPLGLLHNPQVRSVAEALGFQTVPSQARYDVIIAGAGPAGLAASIYSASEGLRVLLVDRFAVGGQAGTSSRIENYLGFPAGIAGDDLTMRALKQAKHFGVEIVVQREITSLNISEDLHSVILDGDEKLQAPVVLLATGVSWHRLAFKGHDAFLNKGITYGASRMDGVAARGQRVFIVGGGNSAGQAAVFYSSYASEVVILVRGPGLAQSMSDYLIQQIQEKENIRVEAHTQVIEARGSCSLDEVVTRTRNADGSVDDVAREASFLFIMIGATAKTAWLPDELQRSADGYIYTGRDVDAKQAEREPFALETSVPGIFCAGDVRCGSIKRVASGVGEGSMSVAYMHQYLSLIAVAIPTGTPVTGRVIAAKSAGRLSGAARVVS